MNARAARDKGIATAAAHADDVSDGWSSMAYLVLRNWCRKYDANFTAEQVRAWAHINGLPVPPDGRAWGSVFQRAAKEGLISKHSYKQATGLACHMHPVTVWRVANV